MAFFSDDFIRFSKGLWQLRCRAARGALRGAAAAVLSFAGSQFYYEAAPKQVRRAGVAAADG
jgi:hypothetical protein